MTALLWSVFSYAVVAALVIGLIINAKLGDYEPRQSAALAELDSSPGNQPLEIERMETFTAMQLASLLKIDVESILAAIKLGSLVAYPEGGCWHIPEDEAYVFACECGRNPRRLGIYG